MKVICLSTLDKFSRFYADIEKQLNLKTNQKVSFKIYSIYFSGFLYLFVRIKYNLLISKKAILFSWFYRKKYNAIRHKDTVYKDITYNNYIKFHQHLKVSKKALQLQALAYIDIFDSIFKTQQTDVLITIGDSRLCVEIAIAVAKKYKVTIYYIEQGPFGTTFFDTEGVNANLSIRKQQQLQIKKPSEPTFEINLNNTKKKYNRSPIYRGLDMLFKFIFENTGVYPADLKYTDLNTFQPKQSTKQRIPIAADTSIFLLILQVPVDVNMIYHSPIFKSHTQLLKAVYNSLPANTQLVVREHPLYINKYDSELYNFAKQHQIVIDNSTLLKSMLKKATVVIVNNSTVGFEAIVNHKPVVVLGNAFYDFESICLKLEPETDLKVLLSEALNFTPDISKINQFKQLLCNTVLLEGAITDQYLKSSKTIANHLLVHH